MSAHPVRGYIAANNISIAELSGHVGQHTGHVGMVLSGRRPASPAFRTKVAEYLGKPVGELFHDEDAELSEHIDQIASRAPALTPEQRDRLAQILRGAA